LSLAVRKIIFDDGGLAFKYPEYEDVPSDPLGDVPVDIPTDSTPTHCLDDWSKEMLFFDMSH
jgi:hypothetical protein